MMDPENALEGQNEEALVEEQAPRGAKATSDAPEKGSSLGSMLALLGVTLAIAALVVGSIALARVNEEVDNQTLPSQAESGDNQVPTDSTDPVVPVNSLEGSTTLFEIERRGVLNCGITITPGFGEVSELNGELSYSGFDVDLCRAVAASIFGNSDDPDKNVEYTVLTATDRFRELQEKEVDMLARITTFTMDRDVWIPEAAAGFAFSVPYIYDGHRFAGEPEFVACAENLDVTTGICANLRVCVNDGTTTLEQLQELLPMENIVIAPSNEDVQMTIVNGGCNALFAGSNAIAEPALREAGYSREYAVSQRIFSREPLALVTREDDPRFSDFVNWILQAILSAEELNISQEEFASFSRTDLFGDTFELMFQNAIGQVGNYAEIYERNLEVLIPRGGLNGINLGDSGRILAEEFGALERAGPTPEGTLIAIKERGHVSCGVTRRAGFAEFDPENGWSGLDVDYCRALSAAIFDGVSEHVVYHALPATDRFEALASGLVDVLSRITTHTFERDVLEPTTNMGYTFTRPDFYDGLSFGGIPPFGDCADRLDTTSESCQGLRICVNDGTTTIAGTRALFPEANIVPMPSGEESLGGLASGACNAVAGGSHDIARASVESAGYTGSYEIGSTRYSKDPLAIVTRQDDPVFSDFVFWVLEATFYAEEQGITQTTASEMPTTNLFGPYFRNMLRDAVQAVGNYAEIYARNVEEIVPRSGLNSYNRDNSPQFYPLPGISFMLDPSMMMAP